MLQTSSRRAATRASSLQQRPGAAGGLLLQTTRLASSYQGTYVGRPGQHSESFVLQYGVSIENQGLGQRGLDKRYKPKYQPASRDGASHIVRTESVGSARIAYLNAPNAGNKLDVGMVRALRQVLTAWEGNPAVTMVILRGATQSLFSAGTSAEQLLKTVRSSEAASASSSDSLQGSAVSAAMQYLREQYLLHELIASYSKPITAAMHGTTYGSSSFALARHTAFPYVTENSSVCLGDVTEGILPHAGSTYWLSRMPGGTGMYMALTGARLQGTEAFWAGLAPLFGNSGEWDREIARTSAELHSSAVTGWDLGSDPVYARSLRELRKFADDAKQEVLMDNLSEDVVSESLEEYIRLKRWYSYFAAGDRDSAEASLASERDLSLQSTGALLDFNFSEAIHGRDFLQEPAYAAEDRRARMAATAAHANALNRGALGSASAGSDGAVAALGRPDNNTAAKLSMIARCFGGRAGEDPVLQVSAPEKAAVLTRDAVIADARQSMPSIPSDWEARLPESVESMLMQAYEHMDLTPLAAEVPSIAAVVRAGVQKSWPTGSLSSLQLDDAVFTYSAPDRQQSKDIIQRGIALITGRLLGLNSKNKWLLTDPSIPAREEAAKAEAAGRKRVFAEDGSEMSPLIESDPEELMYNLREQDLFYGSSQGPESPHWAKPLRFRTSEGDLPFSGGLRRVPHYRHSLQLRLDDSRFNLRSALYKLPGDAALQREAGLGYYGSRLEEAARQAAEARAAARAGNTGAERRRRVASKTEALSFGRQSAASAKQLGSASRTAEMRLKISGRKAAGSTGSGASASAAGGKVRPMFRFERNSGSRKALALNQLRWANEDVSRLVLRRMAEVAGLRGASAPSSEQLAALAQLNVLNERDATELRNRAEAMEARQQQQQQAGAEGSSGSLLQLNKLWQSISRGYSEAARAGGAGVGGSSRSAAAALSTAGIESEVSDAQLRAALDAYISAERALLSHKPGMLFAAAKALRSRDLNTTAHRKSGYVLAESSSDGGITLLKKQAGAGAAGAEDEGSSSGSAAAAAAAAAAASLEAELEAAAAGGADGAAAGKSVKETLNGPEAWEPSHVRSALLDSATLVDSFGLPRVTDVHKAAVRVTDSFRKEADGRLALPQPASVSVIMDRLKAEAAGNLLRRGSSPSSRGASAGSSDRAPSAAEQLRRKHAADALRQLESLPSELLVATHGLIRKAGTLSVQQAMKAEFRAMQRLLSATAAGDSLTSSLNTTTSAELTEALTAPLADSRAELRFPGRPAAKAAAAAHKEAFDSWSSQLAEWYESGEMTGALGDVMRRRYSWFKQPYAMSWGGGRWKEEKEAGRNQLEEMEELTRSMGIPSGEQESSAAAEEGAGAAAAAGKRGSGKSGPGSAAAAARSAWAGKRAGMMGELRRDSTEQWEEVAAAGPKAVAQQLQAFRSSKRFR